VYNIAICCRIVDSGFISYNYVDLRNNVHDLVVVQSLYTPDLAQLKCRSGSIR